MVISIPIIFLGIVATFYSKKNVAFLFLGALCLIYGVISNPIGRFSLPVETDQLPDGYALSINLTKVLIGYFLLAVIIKERPLAISKKSVAVSLLIFGLFLLTIGMVTPLYSPLTFSSTHLLWIIVNILSTVLPEEVFFRGYLQKRMSTLTNDKIAAVVISLLFVLSHGYFEIDSYLMALIIIGAGGSYLYLRFNSVFPALLLHTGANISGLLLFAR